MVAGEYVSVHSHADTEQADLKLERAELKTGHAGEHKAIGGDLRRSRAHAGSAFYRHVKFVCDQDLTPVPFH
jgi:hypothetical protein